MNKTCFQSVVAIIPVYDEIGKIGKVIANFPTGIVNKICVVVDRPNKTIFDEIRAAGQKIETSIHLIKNDEVNGIGYAIRQGIKYALDNCFDVIVVMGGNNKDDPKEIPRLLNPIIMENFDYVYGSRFLPGGKHEKTPLFRWIFCRVLSFFWTVFTRKRCTDVTNGFRAYKVKMFNNEHIKIWQRWLNGYALEYYIHYKVLTLGYKTKEVPVSRTYAHQRKRNYSKISIRDWWQIVGPLICLKLGVKK